MNFYICIIQNIATAFNYFENTKKIFEERGVFEMFHNDFPLKQFNKYVVNHNCNTFVHEVEDQSSLKLYRLDKFDYKCSPYLHSNEHVKSVQLKFMFRTGVAGLSQDLHQQHSSGHCKYCGMATKYLLLSCEAY